MHANVAINNRKRNRGEACYLELRLEIYSSTGLCFIYETPQANLTFKLIASVSQIAYAFDICRSSILSVVRFYWRGVRIDHVWIPRQFREDIDRFKELDCWNASTGWRHTRRSVQHKSSISRRRNLEGPTSELYQPTGLLYDCNSHS